MDLWTLLIGLAWFAAVLNILMALRVVTFLDRTLRRGHGHAHTAEETARIGAPAPDFAAAPVQGGARLGLKSLPGRPVLLLFVSPECGPCRLHLPAAVDAVRPARRDEGLALLVVSDSDPTKVRAWAEEVLGAAVDGVDAVIAEHPRDTPQIWRAYNPQGYMPTFSYIDADHICRAAGDLFSPDWNRLAAQWRQQPTPSQPAQPAQ